MTWLGLKVIPGEEESDKEEEEEGGDGSFGGGGGGGLRGSSAADVLPWEEGLDSCPICSEDFDKYWDENGNTQKQHSIYTTIYIYIQ